MLRLLIVCSLFILSSLPPSLLAIRRNYSFAKANDRDQLPNRMSQMVRMEWDGSTTVQYGRATPQSLNLYFALPAVPRPPRVRSSPSPSLTFSVTIDSLDACTCITQSVYDNILAFAWNRRYANRILPEEVVYLTWNHWQSGNGSADNHGRSIYFSATNFSGLENDDPSSWTILSGWQRRARVTVPAENDSLLLEYGSRLALLSNVSHGIVKRRLSFRLISQHELLQLHPWLSSQLSAGRTPRCDWALNFSAKYRLLLPTNGTLAGDNRRRRNGRMNDDGQSEDSDAIEHCSRNKK